MSRRTLPILSDARSRQILKTLCRDHGLTLDLLAQLIEIQRENLGRGRQIGITQDFSATIAEFLDAQQAGA